MYVCTCTVGSDVMLSNYSVKLYYEFHVIILATMAPTQSLGEQKMPAVRVSHRNNYCGYDR